MALELVIVICALRVVTLHQLISQGSYAVQLLLLLVGHVGNLTALLLHCVITNHVDFIALLLWDTLV